MLELIGSNQGKITTKDIEKILKISAEDTRSLLSKLQSSGLIVSTQGRWEKNNQNLSFLTDLPSAFVREHHRAMLCIASKSLDQDQVQERDFSSITFPMSVSAVSVLREVVKNFRREISDSFRDSNAQSIYSLNIQLFPLVKNTLKSLERKNK
jgi:uncharacterized protein (TIGR02147 family)